MLAGPHISNPARSGAPQGIQMWATLKNLFPLDIRVEYSTLP